MFFDADETLEAIYETDRWPRPAPVRPGKSGLLAGILLGVLIGRKTAK